MCTVISLYSHRGIGKTITTVNLGAALNKLGNKVLFVDLNPQSDLTNYFGIKDNSNNVFQAIEDNSSLQPIEIIKGLDIVPSSIDLIECELQLINLKNSYEVLSYLLAPLMKLYDYIIIDCCVGLGQLVVNAFKVSDYILSPIQNKEQLEYLVDTVERFKNLDFKFKTLYYINDPFNENGEIDVLCCNTDNVSYVGKISYDNAINKAKEANTDVFRYDPDSIAASEFMALCNKILSISGN